MSDRRRAWRRINRGLLVAGVGIFLLLNTTGTIPWSFWLLLLPLRLFGRTVTVVFELLLGIVLLPLKILRVIASPMRR